MRDDFVTRFGHQVANDAVDRIIATGSHHNSRGIHPHPITDQILQGLMRGILRNKTRIQLTPISRQIWNHTLRLVAAEPQVDLVFERRR